MYQCFTTMKNWAGPYSPSIPDALRKAKRPLTRRLASADTVSPHTHTPSPLPICPQGQPSHSVHTLANCLATNFSDAVLYLKDSGREEGGEGERLFGKVLAIQA